MPCISTKGGQLLRGFKKKLSRCLNVNVQIKTMITKTKLNLFTNTKTKFPNKTNPMLFTNLLVLNVTVATLVRQDATRAGKRTRLQRPRKRCQQTFKFLLRHQLFGQ